MYLTMVLWQQSLKMVSGVSNGGVENITKSEKLPYLGSIPIKKEIMECADNGKPYALQNEKGKELFSEIVKNILKELNHY